MTAMCPGCTGVTIMSPAGAVMKGVTTMLSRISVLLYVLIKNRQIMLHYISELKHLLLYVLFTGLLLLSRDLPLPS